MATSTPSPPRRTKVPTTSEQSRWLRHELRDWEREGLIDASTAAAISERYVVDPQAADETGSRYAVTRIILGLGAAFLGIGVIWLVAANLESLPPLLRFLAVLLAWIGFAVAAELTEDLVQKALRLLTVLASGAVIFQAAQSLQVPAFRPYLLLAWAASTLIYAYARRSRVAALVGIVLLVAWYIFQVMQFETGVVTVSAAILLAGVAAVAISVLHPDSWEDFAALWLTAGVVLSLAGVFTAAVPESGSIHDWSGALTAGVILALALVVAAAWQATPTQQRELALAVASLVGGLVLTLWRPFHVSSGMTPDDYTLPMWLRTGLAIVIFLLLAGAWAMHGARRRMPAITFAATFAVVIFITFQSFAVFAPIISGATLFLVVGAVMIASGVIADRARRRIESQVRES
ncbi:MAG: DUF2157 domain-containing protein [Actinomycetia bacterium]|nr:DUF2157 domain-containing protein [Actinomycetes bacterium]